MSRLIWLTGLVVMTLLFWAACGPDTGELTEIRAAVDSLQRDVESLRTDLSSSGNNTDEPPVELSDQLQIAVEGATAGAEATAELATRIDVLETEISAIASATEAQNDLNLERLSQLEEELRPPAEVAFTLQLLHASDMDGSTGALTNVENFSAILDGFRRQFPNNTLVLSSGDNYVPGPRYFAAGDDANEETLGVPGNGRGDIALLNAMGFQASGLGNHELDRGTGAFAAAIGFEDNGRGTYPGAMFPYLASNLTFAGDVNLAVLVVPDGQEAILAAGSLAKSAVITVDGNRVGVVGATTPALKSLTGTGGITVQPADGADVDALAAMIQQEVDALVSQGINKVILLAHMQQIAVEKALATRLVDVDIIVAGGSNTILADATDRLCTGDTAADTYPLIFESSKGAPLLLVNTDGDYRYLGRLVVDFDEQGLALPESIDRYVSGTCAADRHGGRGFAGRPIPGVTRVTKSLRGVLGEASVYLAGNRRDVRTQETNLGNLTADANLWFARGIDPEVAVSLKNGGGIRDRVGLELQPPGTVDSKDVVFLPPAANPDSGTEEGEISQYDVETVLRFNNGLDILPLTALQLSGILEHAVGFEGVGEVTVGRFPQIAGMRFSFDPSAPTGKRVRSLAIVDGQGAVTDRVVVEGNLVGPPDQQIIMVTLDFLANGGDGYPFPVPSAGRVNLVGEASQINAPNPDFPDTNGNGVLDGPVSLDPCLATFSVPGTEQDALSEYLLRFFTDAPFDQVETPPLEDRRIQNLGIPGKQDTVFEE